MLEQLINLFFNESLLTDKESSDLLVAFGRYIIASMLIPIIIALFYRKKWNKALFVAFLFCLLTFFINASEQAFIWMASNYTDVIMPFLSFFKIKNTYFFNVFYYAKDYFVLGWFYSLIITTTNNFNKIVLRVSFVLASIMIIHYLFFNGYDAPGMLNPTLNVLYVVILPLFYLWVSQKESLRISLYKNPYFWISMGIFIPNILGLFIHIIETTTNTSDYVLFIKLKVVKNIFDLIGLVLISYGFTKSRYARFIKDNA